MKTLVIGPGGREHAIVRALLRDQSVTEVHAAPGNAGMAQSVPCHPVNAEDPAAVAALAQELGAELVVIGPEAPLAAGVSDALEAAGFAVYGPSKDAAELEASKAFAKEVMAEAQVPTAMAFVAENEDQARSALETFGAPYVVKDDGLAAGKGVVVTEDFAAALAHANECFAAGGKVVIEEFLDGPEVSLFAVCDGTTAVPLEPAQDFKRIFNGDAGPNTGGMGAYSPLPWAPEGLVEEIMERVVTPTLNAMARRGTPFKGTLFCGLALTSRGLRVIEFNVRFGDPETQAVLERLNSPLGVLLKRAATGKLDEQEPLNWADSFAVDVVMAAGNYPDTPRKGDAISGLETAAALENTAVLHAGTRAEGDQVLTSGGRVLAVVGTGATLAEARDTAYAGVAAISWTGEQHRTDIAQKAVEGRISTPVIGEGMSGSAPEVKRGLDHEAPVVPGWKHVYSGKVRDLYVPEDESVTDRMLVVASDRISAYDFVLSSEIPDKGKVLTQLSQWWFEQLAEGDEPILNHVISTDVPAEVAGRAMICRKLDMLPIECIARGYLTGSGLAEYREHGTVTSLPLPEGLVDGSPIVPAIFTPSAKAEVGEHDENISFEQTVERVGLETAEKLRELTLSVYTRAEEIARARGIILADTKVEFGLDAAGNIVLGDEVLTPDSSRFWDEAEYKPGQAQPSFDKQFVRDWLTSEASGWDKASGEEPPALPAEIVEKTRARYIEAYERLTGRTFQA